MKIDVNSILFSPLGNMEISPDSELEQSFSNYAKVFNNVASKLENLISEGGKSADGIEVAISNILVEEDDNDQSVLFNLKNCYESFLNKYKGFLHANQFLSQNLSSLGLDAPELWDIYGYHHYPPYILSDSREAMIGLQFVGCSYLIVDRLWSVYEFLTKKTDAFEFAYEGCKLLGYKWVDFFSSLRYIPRTPFLFLNAVLSFTIGIPMLGKKITNRFSHLEKVGVAFADFPYKYDHQGNEWIMPSPIPQTMTDRIKRLYLPNERKLDLKSQLGLSVALFDYKINKRTKRCVSFAGTRTNCSSIGNAKVMIQNVMTDIFQYFNGPSIMYFASVGILNEIALSYPKNRIYVFGHSLGGGLMQYSCVAINNKRLLGFGYNSAGLSANTLNTIPNKNNRVKVEHICSLHDPVSRVGHQIGVTKYVNSKKGWVAHSLSQLNKKLNHSIELQVSFKKK